MTNLRELICLYTYKDKYYSPQQCCPTFIICYVSTGNLVVRFFFFFSSLCIIRYYIIRTRKTSETKTTRKRDKSSMRSKKVLIILDVVESKPTHNTYCVERRHAKTLLLNIGCNIMRIKFLFRNTIS